jgi:transcription elongation GreA/GreB family factor
MATGLSAAQAGKRLKSMDSSDIKALAKDAHIAGDALKDLNDRAELVRQKALDRALAEAQERLRARRWSDLGERILPVVVKRSCRGCSGS